VVKCNFLIKQVEKVGNNLIYFKVELVISEIKFGWYKLTFAWINIALLLISL
jgi:hypothetical protein